MNDDPSGCGKSHYFATVYTDIWTGADAGTATIVGGATETASSASECPNSSARRNGALERPGPTDFGN